MCLCVLPEVKESMDKVCSETFEVRDTCRIRTVNLLQTFDPRAGASKMGDPSSLPLSKMYPP